MTPTLFTIGQATAWLSKLSSLWSKIRKERKAEIDALGDELLVSPDLLIDYYIPPYIQQYNPADETDEMENNFRAPAFNVIESFFNSKRHNDIRHLFILADSGMGKTSLLAMLKLQHEGSFWPNNYNCVVLKLGENTLHRISELKSRHRTILLLDALDEDKYATGRIADRIEDILRSTMSFFRVIMTCRTQFFPKTKEETFIRQDRVVIAGFTVPVKFISLFDNEQVNQYLDKVCKSTKDKSRARKILNKIEDLRFRPMLLSYLEDLLDESDHNLANPYFLYNSLVDHWLNREIRKNKNIRKVDLLEWCQIFANELTRTNTRELDIDKINDLLFFDEIDSVSLGGRSLLNINSDGHYRFAHKSFQEFLVVRSLKTTNKFDIQFPSEMIAMFMRHTDLAGVSLSNSNFEEANLTGAKFQDTIFFGGSIINSVLDDSNFSRSDLRGANLSGSRFNQSTFVEADLSEADLTKTSFKYSNLKKANFTDTCLDDATFAHSNMEGTNFTLSVGLYTNFKSCQISNTALLNVKFHNTHFDTALFSNTHIEKSILNICFFEASKWTSSAIDSSSLAEAKAQHSLFTNVTIKNTNLHSSSFSDSTFDTVTFENISAPHAIFNNCTFVNCHLTASDFQEASFENSTFINTTFRSSDFTLATFIAVTTKNLTITECTLTSIHLDATTLINPTQLGDTMVTWWASRTKRRLIESKYLVLNGDTMEIDKFSDPILLKKQKNPTPSVDD